MDSTKDSTNDREDDVYISDRVIYAVRDSTTKQEEKPAKSFSFFRRKKKDAPPPTPPIGLSKVKSTFMVSSSTYRERHDGVPDLGGGDGPFPFWWAKKTKAATIEDKSKPLCRVIRIVERVLEMTVHNVRQKPYAPPLPKTKGRMYAETFDLATPAELGLLCTTVARYILMEDEGENALARVRAPAKIFGDIHGQIVDLVQFFRSYGGPSHRTGDVNYCSYVFDGDFVDRGAHSLEVLTVLLCLKIRYHPRVVLVRGNHEAEYANKAYGFHDELKARVGKGWETLYYNDILPLFRNLPLAALVQDRILVCHGGPGLHVKTVEQIEHIPMPVTCSTHVLSGERTEAAEMQNRVVDLLWSDPHPKNLHGLTREESLAYDSETGRPSGPGFNTMRNAGTFFGPDVVESFCKRNNLDMIVRAHECVNGGMQLDGKRCITVFSAPNYGNKTNAGAILEISGDLNMQFKALAATDSKSHWANTVKLDVGRMKDEHEETLGVF